MNVDSEAFRNRRSIDRPDCTSEATAPDSGDNVRLFMVNIPPVLFLNLRPSPAGCRCCPFSGLSRMPVSPPDRTRSTGKKHGHCSVCCHIPVVFEVLMVVYSSRILLTDVMPELFCPASTSLSAKLSVAYACIAKASFRVPGLEQEMESTLRRPSSACFPVSYDLYSTDISVFREIIRSELLSTHGLFMLRICPEV